MVFVNGKLEGVNLQYEDSKKFKIQEETKIENSKFQNNSLINLNNAFIINNYKVYVEKNYKVKKPLLVYHITNSELNSSNINIQLNFLLGENSSLRVIDITNDKSEKKFIDNLENKIRLGVIDENIVASELKAVLKDIRAGAKVKNLDSLISQLSETRMLKTATRIYAGGDNLWKWYGHEYVKSQMRSMYKKVRGEANSGQMR